MAHHDLIFQCLVKFQSDGYANQHSRCGEAADQLGVEAYLQQLRQQAEQHGGHECDDGKEHRTPESNTSYDFVEVIGCFSARTNTGYETAVTLDVFGNLDGIELYCRVEVGKYKDQYCENYVVHQDTYPRATYGGCGGSSHILYPPLFKCATGPERADKHCGEAHECVGEDQRHNATGVDFDGDERALSAVHLVALDLLCILHLDFSFGTVYPNDKRKYQNQRH